MALSQQEKETYRASSRQRMVLVLYVPQRIAEDSDQKLSHPCYRAQIRSSYMLLLCLYYKHYNKRKENGQYAIGWNTPRLTNVG